MSDPTTPPAAPTPDEIAAAKAVLSAAGFNLVPLDAFDRDALVRDPADDPYPVELRDVVRGQTLALLSATSHEGVRCATNAIASALRATAPGSDEPEQNLTDRLAAFMDTDVGRTLTAMALQYMNPSAPPAPTPNLTVTGPHGTEVQVLDGGLLIAHRMVGVGGVLNVAVPKKMLEVRTAPYVGDKARVVATLLDFTEESHALDALVADANVHGTAPATPEAPKAEAAS